MFATLTAVFLSDKVSDLISKLAGVDYLNSRQANQNTSPEYFHSAIFLHTRRALPAL